MDSSNSRRERSVSRNWLGGAGASELDILDGLLEPAEWVETVVYGQVLESRKPAFRRWLIAITSERLVCIRGSRSEDPRVIEMRLRSIKRLVARSQLFSTRIRLTTRETEVKLRLPRAMADTFKTSILAGIGK
jgi:hypothetical protein